MTTTPFEVYTDRIQCARFGVSYMDPEATLAISAIALLASKDYDHHHRKMLAPLGNDTLILTRTPDLGPGWWRVTRRVPAWPDLLAGRRPE